MVYFSLTLRSDSLFLSLQRTASLYFVGSVMSIENIEIVLTNDIFWFGHSRDAILLDLTGLSLSQVIVILPFAVLRPDRHNRYFWK